MTQAENTSEPSSTLFDDEPLLGLMTKDLTLLKTREEMSQFVQTLQTTRASTQTMRAKLEAEVEDEENPVPRSQRKKAAPQAVKLTDYLNL